MCVYRLPCMSRLKCIFTVFKAVLWFILDATLSRNSRKKGRHVIKLSPGSQVVANISNQTTPNSSTLTNQPTLPHSEQHMTSPRHNQRAMSKIPAIEQPRDHSMASNHSLRSHDSVTSSHNNTPTSLWSHQTTQPNTTRPGSKLSTSGSSLAAHDSLTSSNNSVMTSLNRDNPYQPIIERLTKDLVKLQAQQARRGSDSTESVRSDTELLDDDVTAAQLPNQLECAFINSTLPGNTPMAVWRKSGTLPSTCYSSYLDYKGPGKMHLKTFQIDLDKNPAQNAATKSQCTCPAEANTKNSYNQLPKIVYCENGVECSNVASQPAGRKDATTVHVTHLDETDCTGNGILYSASDISDCLKLQVTGDKAAHSLSHKQAKNLTGLPQNSSQHSLTQNVPLQDAKSSASCSVHSSTTAAADVTRDGYRTPNSKAYVTPATSQFRLTSVGRRTPSLSPSEQSTLEVTDSSHVADPRELCTKIDQIFFNESEV